MWRDDLVALVGSAGAYRAPPLSAADLEAVLEAENASAEHRLGAALALRALATDDAAPRRRIRIAAERTASPAIRAALDEVAESDDERAYLDAVSTARARVEAP